MTALPPDTTLDALRRDIDVIDDAILDLLMRRLAATGKVKATKMHDGSIAFSPFRPGREAAVLRRLIARGGGVIPVDVLVRLWRVILSSSTQSQAPVRLHMAETLARDIGARLLVSQHFCGMDIGLHRADADALAALEVARGDLAIVSTGSPWAEDFCRSGAGGAAVIGTLPVITAGGAPQLLVFGHAEAQASGDDETIILTAGPPGGLSAHCWQARSGGWTLTSLPGFLDAAHPSLRELLSGSDGARIAGRSPRPIKV